MWVGVGVGEWGGVFLSCTTIVFHDTIDQLVCLFHMVCFISLSKSQICYLPLSLTGMYHKDYGIFYHEVIILTVSYTPSLVFSVAISLVF